MNAMDPVEMAEMCIRWVREDCDLKHIMAHPMALDAFMEFCRSEFSEENVLFFMDMEMYAIKSINI